MSVVLPPVPTLSAAWSAAFAAATAAPSGQLVHVLMTVTEPAAEIRPVRTAVDAVLADTGAQSVETVASTIFPVDLYPVPPLAWDPELQERDRAVLDGAATALYDRYLQALPLLRTADGNAFGTYFQRMISYPGPGPGGFNQLASRIAALRAMRRTAAQGNFFNLDLAADGAQPPRDQLEGGDAAGAGLQLLRPGQKRQRGFPCLVHVDLTVQGGTLHLFAVYRRQNLLSKAYGNLVGLSRLQAFLCQQTGLGLGQLTVMATFADAERAEFGIRRIRALAADTAAAVAAAAAAADPNPDAACTVGNRS
jgi:hypothetical protein